MQAKKIMAQLTVGTLVATQLWGCASEDKNTNKGLGIGAAAGALAGAVIGNQSGNAAKGAAIGAALGAGVGGYVGHRLDNQEKELKKIAETKRTDQGLITKLKSDILFEKGKADLKDGAKTNLQQMAEILKKYPEDVLSIKGYTDNTGSEKINESLSQKRAESVRSELIKYGIPDSAMKSSGLGPANPVADNKTPDGRKQNRRVEIEIGVDESKVPKKE